MEDPATDLTQLTVEDLLARLASRDPVPGGGSASALAAALAAALVAMVAELSLSRAAEADRTLLVDSRGHALALQEQLQMLASADAAAYAAVVRARRLPRDDDEQREVRRQSVAEAARLAAEIPLRTARAAASVVDLAGRVAAAASPNAVSDIGVAAHLAVAGVRGAILNVRINLPSLAVDDALGLAAADELDRLEVAAIARAGEVSAAVSARMPS